MHGRVEKAAMAGVGMQDSVRGGWVVPANKTRDQTGAVQIFGLADWFG